MVLSQNEPRAVETLEVGDLIVTADRRVQPISWIGNVAVPLQRLKVSPEFIPVRIKANAFGSGCPERDMLVSQQHRILLRDFRAQLFFGQDEVLVAAKHLLNDHSILLAQDVQSVIYFHILFDNHKIIVAHDIETESFLPGPTAMSSVSQAARNELYALFPQLMARAEAFGYSAPSILIRTDARILTC